MSFNRKKDKKTMPRELKLMIGAVVTVFSLIVVLSLVFGAWYSVGEGEVGIKFTKFGDDKGFAPNELGQGWGFKVPFKERIITMPFRTQEIGFFGATDKKGSFGVITPKDKNGINFDVDVTVRYRIDPTQASEFIEQKGEGIPAMQQIMSTAVRADSTRGVFGQYAQEDIPLNRIEIAQEVLVTLQKRLDKEATGKLKPGFMVIEAVDLRNVQFDERIETAIVNKQTQKQVAERKEYELQQAVKDKEIAIVHAEKEKQAKILVAEGEGEAVLILATNKAKGIQKVNDAYQSMPYQYVTVKAYEAIKETDKVIIGLDSIVQEGTSLGFLDINKVIGPVIKKQIIEETEEKVI